MNIRQAINPYGHNLQKEMTRDQFHDSWLPSLGNVISPLNKYNLWLKTQLFSPIVPIKSIQYNPSSPTPGGKLGQDA